MKDQNHERVFYFPVACDLRAYGAVRVTAADVETAKSKVTAEFISENFEPHGSTEDIDYSHPNDIWIESVTDESTGDETYLEWAVEPGPWQSRTIKLWTLVWDSDNGTSTTIFQSADEMAVAIKIDLKKDWDEITGNAPIPDNWEDMWERIQDVSVDYWLSVDQHEITLRG